MLEELKPINKEEFDDGVIVMKFISCFDLWDALSTLKAMSRFTITFVAFDKNTIYLLDMETFHSSYERREKENDSL